MLSATQTLNVELRKLVVAACYYLRIKIFRENELINNVLYVVGTYLISQLRNLFLTFPRARKRGLICRLYAHSSSESARPLRV